MVGPGRYVRMYGTLPELEPGQEADEVDGPQRDMHGEVAAHKKRAEQLNAEVHGIRTEARLARVMVSPRGGRR